VSDDLAVGGPGATSVLTTELVHQSYRFSALHQGLGGMSHRLAGLDRVVGNGVLRAADAPQSALLAESAIDSARVALSAAAERSVRLARGLASAADGYQFADRFAARLGQELAARLAYGVGVLLPVILLALLPGAVILGSAGTGAVLAMPEKSRARLFSALGSWLRSNSGALSDPKVVELVRMTVMSADDFGGGLLGAPPELVHLLGDEGLGLSGVDTSAAVIAALGSDVGLLRETPVTVKAGNTASGIPNASGVQDRVARIPKEPAQIRIDRYSSPGEPDRFEVYIAGTADLSLSGDREPWDMTSNLTALAGDGAGSYGAGSYRAVEEAMRQAGIGATSPVTFTGYSQGGLLAAQLAASGDYTVDGLVTLGAPAGQVAVPHDIPYLAVEHTNDLVPALGGTFASSEPVVVRRELFDGAPPTGGAVLPAHELSNYLDTARLIDHSDNEQLGRVLDRLRHAEAATVDSTVYLARRE
jgi:hypothetical protein